VMPGLDIDVEDLYRDAMTFGRNLYAELWAELHPDGKPLMQVALTPEMLRGMTPEARQILVARFPREVMKALGQVK